MGIPARTWLTVAACAFLAACPAVTRKTPERSLSLPPIPTADLQGATIYTVNGAASDLHVLVFRGGSFARLGHNHVMSSRSVTGRIWLNAAVEKSGFDLSFPVNDLIVDDPEARRAAGSDFPPEIAQADRDGTRKNMLRAAVLDGDSYPTIRLRSVRVLGSQSVSKVIARITIKDVSRDVAIPTAVTVNGTSLTASGEFDIQQTDFGITPFSIAMGAIAVQDKLQIKFRLEASR